VIVLRPTIIQVAARAGVSKSTASLALRGAPVSSDARSRVRAAADELGYVHDRAAAAMRGGRSGTIGLIVSDLTNPFYAELCAGVSERLEADGALALLSDTREDLDRQARVLGRMREHRLDGLILSAAVGTEASALGQQMPAGLPVVQALRRVEGLATDYSGADNAAGTSAVGRYLVQLGHRRIAFAGGTAQTSVQRDRYGGLASALAAEGHPAPVRIPCPATLAGGVAAAEAALDHRDKPTALVCFNDVIAIGATIALAQRRLLPGHDLSVVGFDDIAEAALRRPALTTVSIQPRAIGRRAAELILERLEEPNGPPRAVIQDTRLVCRETTAAPKSLRRQHA
jgi:LacI family transcriptional regulator